MENKKSLNSSHSLNNGFHFPSQEMDYLPSPSHIEREEGRQEQLILSGSQDLEYQQLNKDPLRKEDYHKQSIKEHLRFCGSFINIDYSCKKCEAENHKETIQTQIIKTSCGLRYCSHLHCILSRYARLFNQLKNNQRLKSLKTLWHLSIGWGYIDPNNFTQERKKKEKEVNLFLKILNKTLEKKGIKPFQGFRFLDLTNKGKGKVYFHNHILAIPYIHKEQKEIMQISQGIIKKRKLSFHIQFYGNNSKLNLLSYMSKRVIGLYKPQEKPLDYIKGGIKKLSLQIQNGEFIFLNELIDFETYFRSFYKRRLFSTFGGLPYGSIIVDNFSEKIEILCKIHGKLARSEYKLHFLLVRPPPDLQDRPQINTFQPILPKCSPAIEAIFRSYDPETPEFKERELQERFTDFLKNKKRFEPCNI